MKITKIILLATTALLLSNCGFEVVDPGHRGIKINLGEVVGEPLPEGLHYYNPFTSDIKEFNIRQETWTQKTTIFTKDTQKVEVEFAVTYMPEAKAINKIYMEVGREDALIEKIIKPVSLGSIKDSIGQVIADELVSKREMVTRDALKEVQENLGHKHVVVTDLQFTNLDFDDAYEKAVEEKVVAIQQAQKAKNETVTIQEQAKQTVLSAQAQAESMKIQSQALAQNKGLIQYELAKKWNGVLPQYMIGNAVPLLDMSGMKAKE
jgi:regulator of protease activity HflC (stomatin/prohibitin superfamily)